MKNSCTSCMHEIISLRPNLADSLKHFKYRILFFFSAYLLTVRRRPVYQSLPADLRHLQHTHLLGCTRYTSPCHSEQDSYRRAVTERFKSNDVSVAECSKARTKTVGAKRSRTKCFFVLFPHAVQLITAYRSTAHAGVRSICSRLLEPDH